MHFSSHSLIAIHHSRDSKGVNCQEKVHKTYLIEIQLWKFASDSWSTPSVINLGTKMQKWGAIFTYQRKI